MDFVTRQFSSIPIPIIILATLLTLVGYALYLRNNHGLAQIVGGLVVSVALGAVGAVIAGKVYTAYEGRRVSNRVESLAERLRASAVPVETSLI
jgi:uncharacterized membrane protein YeaQ/YmgE (transglycosylase-associated protein family)